jgi:hypothetical protein
MTLLFLLTLGALFALLVVGWFAFERQRATYAQMFELLERERDAARHEAAVFRRLVLPVYDRAEKSISVGESPTGSPAVGGARVATPATSAHLPPGVSPKPSEVRLDRRIPFRIRWKHQAAAVNTKQKNTNTLAEALSAQKPAGEKAHA